MKRKTNYFFRLSNSLLIIEERKCEINNEECMYLLFLLASSMRTPNYHLFFVCLFVCLFVYQATLHIIDLITLVIMNSFPLGLAHH